MISYEPDNQESFDPDEKHSSKRLVDSLTQNIFSSLKRDYFVIGKHRIRSWNAWLMIGVLAGGTFTLALVANRRGEFESSRADIASVPLNAEAQDLNLIKEENRGLKALLEQDFNQKRAVSSGKPLRQALSVAELENKMLERARRRLDAMTRVISHDPRAILVNRIPPHERSLYPVKVQDEFEQEVKQEGVLEIVHGDDSQNHTGFTEYTLLMGAERFELYFTDVPHQRLVSGMRVRIKGTRVRSAVAVPIR